MQRFSALDGLQLSQSHPNLDLEPFPQLGSLIAAMWDLVEKTEDLSRFESLLVEQLHHLLAAQGVSLLHQQSNGEWGAKHQAGAAPLVPTQSIDALDHTDIYQGPPTLLHLAFAGQPRRIVAIEGVHEAERFYGHLLRILQRGFRSFRVRIEERRRIERLSQVLSMVETWHQSDDLPSLLTCMAESSTRFFHAERASIFLWDRPKKQLIGRPALGVEGGKLIVPDDKGVVSAVVRSGEPRRVDDMLEHEVNREIDAQLQFHTRSLLCVPLLDRKGKVFGAFELINKRDGNFTLSDETGLVEVAVHAAAVLESSQQIADLLEVRDRIASAQAAELQLVGNSPAMVDLRKSIDRIASTNLPVLVLGENGTGKEVVSRLIHFSSPRRSHPLVAVNCAALPETLLESELFGHEKGAFTGATETKAGKFELASGGTLFLDEIGDMSLPGQAKLLRVLEDGLVTRLGGQVDIPTDTRVVAATNQDLPKLIETKAFRQDLFYRLDVVSVRLPPLRERGEDIILLGERFLEQFARKAHREIPQLANDAKERLLRHPWPGNVRELRSVMERVVFLTDNQVLSADQLPFDPKGDGSDHKPTTHDLSTATEQFQTEFIRRHLKQTGGNMSQAAKIMGIDRSNLHRKMKHLGLLP